jgi:membrane protease subunit HflK
MKSAGIGASLVAAVVVLIWLGTGFFIVQEGQQAVITQFGRYKAYRGRGFQLAPARIRSSAMSWCSSRRSAPSTWAATPVVKATGLRDSAMLTEDENIVEIKFAVQYRPERRARLPVREQEPL